MATGDFGGRLNIWYVLIFLLTVQISDDLLPTYNRDLERIEVPVYSVKGHSEIINAIDAIGGLGIGGGAPEIVTGSRDGK